ncbi:hypothetical protein ACIB24_12610 [Spongisporangium articulatum]|uniref:NADH dehydrogenase subunit 6 n=1 Tax=Spongisporangium articulatum TaxID=3362603 RepID=A0ABW8ANF4_9ACTN
MQLWLLLIVVGAVLLVLGMILGILSTLFGWLGVLAISAGAILTLTGPTGAHRI